MYTFNVVETEAWPNWREVNAVGTDAEVRIQDPDELRTTSGERTAWCNGVGLGWKTGFPYRGDTVCTNSKCVGLRLGVHAYGVTRVTEGEGR